MRVLPLDRTRMQGGSSEVSAATYGLGDSGFGNASKTTTEDVYAYRLIAPHDQTYYFAFNKDVVSKRAIKSIKVQATYLIDHPGVKIRLAGNTDERGSREYNIALGWRRAKAVASILEQNGISPSQMVLISYGEERPVAFCHQEKCYKLNRRVNLTYLSGTK